MFPIRPKLETFIFKVVPDLQQVCVQVVVEFDYFIPVSLLFFSVPVGFFKPGKRNKVRKRILEHLFLIHTSPIRV